MASAQGAHFRWGTTAMDLGNLPSYVTAAHSGFNPGLLVGSKVYVIGMLGRPEGINGTGTTIGICDLRLKKWTWVRDPSPDAPYMNGNVVFLVDDWLYCHGGYVGNNFLSDKMFRLDLTTLEWSTLVTRGMKPPGLVWHAGQYLERHNKYVCFSGQLMRNRMAAATHEVSVNHVSQMKWYKPQVKGHVPALQGAASCLVVEKIFFFGGLDSQWHGLETDLHILESQDKSWMNLNWTSVDLGIGLSCGSLKYINGYLLIFGGFGENLQQGNSLYICELPSYTVYDLSDSSREKYTIRGSVAETYGHSMIVYCGDLYVFDGYGGTFMPSRLKRI